jgi:hypothetical protein
MKRELIENVKVIPYTNGAVIDRSGFLSGILGLKINPPTGSPTAASVTVALTESDTSGGTFTPAADTLAIVDGNALDIDLAAGLDANIDIDLVGVKRFIKLTAAINFTGGTSPAAVASYAVALGDPEYAPA